MKAKTGVLLVAAVITGGVTSFQAPSPAARQETRVVSSSRFPVVDARNNNNELSSSSWSSSATSLSLSLLGAPADPDLDLVVGYGTIAAACSPYVLSILLPNYFDNNFFLPIYKNSTDEEALYARRAEIGWKVRYTTLSLVLTTLAFAEVVWFPDNPPTTLLRDSYIVWAGFFILASLKIVREYKDDMLAIENRFFIQAWHLLVAAIFCLDVSTSPHAEETIAWIKDIFTI